MTYHKFNDLVASLNQSAKKLSLSERLHMIADTVDGRIVFTTSFGIEDQAITHAIHLADAQNIELATLDTGRLFAETYALWAETEQKYGLRIKVFAPKGEAIETLIAKDGPNGFYHSPDARKGCCHVRKVEPLARALAGAAGWITGLRGDQSNARSAIHFAEFDAIRGLLKFSPLFDWTREKVDSYAREANIPVNPLHDKGFVSIGCAPCTRAIQPGETERAGRWWWENESAKECGLHVNAEGRIVRDLKPQSASQETFR